MKAHTEYRTFRTEKRREYVNITSEVEKAVSASGVREGMALVSAMHITAGVYVNDAEDGLIADIDEWLFSFPAESAARPRSTNNHTNFLTHNK